MNRRRFIGMIPACAVLAAPADGWATVAHLGRNLNGRAYSVGNLRDMARDARGMWIVRGNDENTYPTRPSLGDAIGVVAEARYHDECVQVRGHWFRGNEDSHGFITPSGCTDSMARMAAGYDAMGKGYRLTSFALNSHSAFARATLV